MLTIRPDLNGGCGEGVRKTLRRTPLRKMLDASRTSIRKQLKEHKG